MNIIKAIQEKYNIRKSEILNRIKTLKDSLNLLISDLMNKKNSLPADNANSSAYNSQITSILNLQYSIAEAQTKLDDAYAELYKAQEEEKVEMIAGLMDYTNKSENSILPYKLTTVWDDKKVDDDEKKYIFSMAVKTVIFIALVVILIKLFKS